jgi:hypothetical protein
MPGLAEAGRIWHTHFTRWLVEVMGLIQSIVDLCIFSRVSDGGRDILIIASSSTDSTSPSNVPVTD